MKLTSLIPGIILVALGCNACCADSPAQTPTDSITVACYYFPGYHTQDSAALNYSGLHPHDWSEWELVKEANPRFDGHQQPKVPLWGYGDEKDPAVMAQKIRAAASHGIDVFIFDWYTYQGRPFLNRCLDEGFLGAPNTDSLKFALMWANHNWLDLFPYTVGEPKSQLYSGLVDSASFETIGDDLIRRYFLRPNYWKIEGKPYFSIYDLQSFVTSFGSPEGALRAMKRLDEKAVQAGLKGVHWNLVAWGRPILPGTEAAANLPELIRQMAFNSATSYVWVHHVGMDQRETPYDTVRNRYMAYWDQVKPTYDVPYFPNVTMGWDPSPRTNQNQKWDPSFGYPYTNLIVDNTPEKFKQALEMTKQRLLADTTGAARVLTINCWNEWTEGSYLEPDTLHKMAYLEALKEVFGR